MTIIWVLGSILYAPNRKMGFENFTKEILFVYDTPEEMYAKETELVNEDFLLEENTYNLKVGGFGGWNYINNHSQQKEWARKGGANMPKHLRIKNGEKTGGKNRQKWLNDPSSRPPKVFTEEFNREMRERAWSDSAREKRRITKEESNFQKGSKNSQFGTMWITDGVESKKIKKTDLIPENWKKGRKLNDILNKG